MGWRWFGAALILLVLMSFSVDAVEEDPQLSDAFLDGERVFEQVREQDGNWLTVGENQVLEIFFDRDLKSGNDITVYVRNPQGLDTWIEVYDSQWQLISDSPIIRGEGYFKVFLSGMSGESGEFFLKVLNADKSIYFGNQFIFADRFQHKVISS